MFTRSRLLLPLLLSLLPSLLVAQNPAYVLNQAGAEKFVRASQQMTQNGAMPAIDARRGPPDFAKIKADLERNPVSQQALTAAGLSSTEFVSFMSAAMSAMMVGQMEAAGLRGALPPGMTQRPSQQNIDFMKQNMDLIQRATTPGLARAAPPAANTTDVGVPMPTNTGSVLASAIMARMPRLDTITPTTDCTFGNIQATIDAETTNARKLAAAQYGNAGFLGARRTPAEGAVYDRAIEPELRYCTTMTTTRNIIANAPAQPAFAQAKAEYDRAVEAAGLAFNERRGKCVVGLDTFDPRCVRAALVPYTEAGLAAYGAYLKAIAQPFANVVTEMQACSLKQEAVVADAKTAKVSGANVNPIMDVLVASWENPPIVREQWTGYCEGYNTWTSRWTDEELSSALFVVR